MSNLRYRYARDKADRLGQVFTPDSIANLLIGSIPAPACGIKQIIDLGAGQGALTTAALKRFHGSSALLVEIDPFYADILNSTMPKNVNVVEGDALGVGWDTGIQADIVISNPPYGMLPMSESIASLLLQANINIPTSHGWVRGDAAFVARAWTCSARGAGIGLIVTSSLVRDPAFRKLRATLVNQLQGLCITQLDTRIFNGAEVQAFLITGLRSLSRKRKVLLRKASVGGVIVDELQIGWDAAINRLDFDYYKAMEKIGVSSSISTDTLASVGTTVVRGSRSRKDFQRLGLNAFHTTDFKEFSGELLLNEYHSKFTTARSGDVLIPRVGSRCLQHQAKIVRGEGFFTDCVYRLSAKPPEMDRVWRTLSSSFGTEWRLANASGNCAKHLTVQTLLGMPLIS